LDCAGAGSICSLYAALEAAAISFDHSDFHSEVRCNVSFYSLQICRQSLADSVFSPVFIKLISGQKHASTVGDSCGTRRTRSDAASSNRI
jgi:hypothetical protein